MRSKLCSLSIRDSSLKYTKNRGEDEHWSFNYRRAVIWFCAVLLFLLWLIVISTVENHFKVEWMVCMAFIIITLKPSSVLTLIIQLFKIENLPSQYLHINWWTLKTTKRSQQSRQKVFWFALRHNFGIIFDVISDKLHFRKDESQSKQEYKVFKRCDYRIVWNIWWHQHQLVKWYSMKL